MKKGGGSSVCREIGSRGPQLKLQHEQNLGTPQSTNTGEAMTAAAPPPDQMVPLIPALPP